MNNRLYDKRITFRLSGRDKEDIRNRAMAEGVTVAHLLRFDRGWLLRLGEKTA
jgi:predicted DNA binding CopG/RHH family protein